MFIAKLTSSVAHLLRTDEHEKDNVEKFIEQSITESLQLIEATFEDVVLELSIYCFDVSQNQIIQWRVVCTGCYLLIKLSEQLNTNNDLLSISQKLNIKRLLQFIISNGIHPSLLPGVGISDHKVSVDILNHMEKYNRLTAVCKFINNIYTCEELKNIFLTNFFNDYLAALHQLSYAPIVKPNSVIILNNQPFTITMEIWESLQSDQKYFKEILKTIIYKTPQPIIIKELIVLQGAKAHPLPNFMRRALSKQLSECLTTSGGLHALMQCLLDSSSLDIGSQWRNIDMITRLVSVKHGSMSDEKYLKNICDQLSNIMQSVVSNSYIIVAAACTASLYEKFKGNKDMEALISTILSSFMNLPASAPDDTVLLTTLNIEVGVCRLDLCFSHPKLSLPTELLNPLVDHLFLLRICLGKSSVLSSKLDNILSIFMSSQSCNKQMLFDLLILRKECDSLPMNRTIKFEIVSNEIVGKCSSNISNVNVRQCIDTLIEIIDASSNSGVLAYNLFSYLLNILSVSNYSASREEHIPKDINSDTQLNITRALEILASKDCVIKSFKNNPNIILNFIKEFLEQFSTNMLNGMYSRNNVECLTISLVLISTLLCDTGFCKNELMDIVNPLKVIKKQSTDEGIRYLCKEILDGLTCKSMKDTKRESKFDQAVNQICDPLLPVRAHGLMELTKLVEEEDFETLSKKEFVQCIFQENLKDPDSYVYLTAIKGLSTLAIHCAEDVLELISKEYLNESNNMVFTSEAEDENIKIRMKIGEILLKVTKCLGEKAMDHKVILLNTFLSGCHDTDDFIRASSLSNLAELCRVLSYKLGDIIFDILKCVDNIIQYDKSIECRRASVLVISSLIKGLGKESLLFLRDALLPMYRTLKKLYNDEKEDPAVRLHAQIALEELNDIMRELLVPYLRNND